MQIYIAPIPRYPLTYSTVESSVAPLIFPDGNTRLGYRNSAAKVAEVGEYCARLHSIRELTLLLLSSQNVAHRSDHALGPVADAIKQLLKMVHRQGSLKRAGVRCSLVGTLDRLKARGGEGEEIAKGMQALIQSTDQPKHPKPRLELKIAVDCDDTLLARTHTNIILRTAAEDANVVRPSGVSLSGGIMCVATKAPWPAFDVAVLDAALRAYSKPPFAWEAYDARFVVQLLKELKPPRNKPTIDLYLPVRATADKLRKNQCLDDALRTRNAVAKLMDGTVLGRAWRRMPAIRLHLVSSLAVAKTPAAGDSMVLPHQRGSALWIPPKLPGCTWYALHACDPTVGSIAHKVTAAVTFIEENPPLCGADRFTLKPPRLQSAGEDESGIRLKDAEREDAEREDADCAAFIAARVREAKARKLHLDDPYWERALRHYMRIAYKAPEGSVYSMPMANYQQIVAFVDEALFDRHYPDECATRRQRRLAELAAYLSRAARGIPERDRLQIRGACHAQKASAEIRRLNNQHKLSSDQRILNGWSRSMEQLFEASVEEYRPWPCPRPADCECHKDTVLQRRVWDALQIAPTPIRTNINRPVSFEREYAHQCRTILLRLCCTAASVGAGGLFWAAALRETRKVTLEMLEALNEAATLLDYVVRLDNDLSDADRRINGDRDGKTNCITILLGEPMNHHKRDLAIKAGRACSSWLHGLFKPALKRLIECWSELGLCMKRGAKLGEKVYKSGHFKETSDAQMAKYAQALD